MKKMIVYIFCLSLSTLLVAQEGGGFMPSFSKSIPFYGANGKVKSISYKHYAEGIGFDSDQEDVDVGWRNFRTVFFDRQGAVDSIFNYTSFGSITKEYFKDEVTNKIVFGRLGADNDTVMESMTEFSYSSPQKNLLIADKRTTYLQEGRVFNETDTSWIDFDNQSITYKIYSNSLYTAFYENGKVIKTENRELTDEGEVLNMRVVYVYSEGNRVEKMYLDGDGGEPVEAILAYDKFDEQGNWLEQISWNAGAEKRKSKVVRQIEYW